MLDQPAAQLPVVQRADPQRSCAEEVRALRLGDGEIFRGKGILAVAQFIPNTSDVAVVLEPADAVASARVAAIAAASLVLHHAAE